MDWEYLIPRADYQAQYEAQDARRRIQGWRYILIGNAVFVPDPLAHELAKARYIQRYIGYHDYYTDDLD